MRRASATYHCAANGTGNALNLDAPNVNFRELSSLSESARVTSLPSITLPVVSFSNNAQTHQPTSNRSLPFGTIQTETESGQRWQSGENSSRIRQDINSAVSSNRLNFRDRQLQPLQQNQHHQQARAIILHPPLNSYNYNNNTSSFEDTAISRDNNVSTQLSSTVTPCISSSNSNFQYSRPSITPINNNNDAMFGGSILSIRNRQPTNANNNSSSSNENTIFNNDYRHLQVLDNQSSSTQPYQRSFCTTTTTLIPPPVVVSGSTISSSQDNCRPSSSRLPLTITSPTTTITQCNNNNNNSIGNSEVNNNHNSGLLSHPSSYGSSNMVHTGSTAAASHINRRDCMPQLNTHNHALRGAAMLDGRTFSYQHRPLQSSPLFIVGRHYVNEGTNNRNETLLNNNNNNTSSSLPNNRDENTIILANGRTVHTVSVNNESNTNTNYSTTTIYPTINNTTWNNNNNNSNNNNITTQTITPSSSSSSSSSSIVHHHPQINHLTPSSYSPATITSPRILFQSNNNNNTTYSSNTYYATTSSQSLPYFQPLNYSFTNPTLRNGSPYNTTESEISTGLSLFELRETTTVIPFEGLTTEEVSSNGQLLHMLNSGNEERSMDDDDDDDGNFCNENTDNTKPSKKKKIKKLRNDDDDDDETSARLCAICCSTFSPGDPLRHLVSCGHRYHVSCIDRWFESNRTCPMCRSNLRHQQQQHLIVNNTILSTVDENQVQSETVENTVPLVSSETPLPSPPAVEQSSVAMNSQEPHENSILNDNNDNNLENTTTNQENNISTEFNCITTNNGSDCSDNTNVTHSTESLIMQPNTILPLLDDPPPTGDVRIPLSSALRNDHLTTIKTKRPLLFFQKTKKQKAISSSISSSSLEEKENQKAHNSKQPFVLFRRQIKKTNTTRNCTVEEENILPRTNVPAVSFIDKIFSRNKCIHNNNIIRQVIRKQGGTS